MSCLACKTLLSAFSLVSVLFSLLYQHHDLTKLRRKIPELAKEVRYLEEENSRLLYEIERFENPKHLLDLAKRPEFSHLRHPYGEEIIVINVSEEPILHRFQKEMVKTQRSTTFFAMNGLVQQ